MRNSNCLKTAQVNRARANEDKTRFIPIPGIPFRGWTADMEFNVYFSIGWAFSGRVFVKRPGVDEALWVTASGSGVRHLAGPGTLKPSNNPKVAKWIRRFCDEHASSFAQLL